MIDVQTDSQLLANKIKDFIKSRRDNKEVALLKNKPDKKGRGGINTKLISYIEDSCSDDENVKEQLEKIRKERKSKESSNLEFEQNKYNLLLSLTDIMDLDLVDEYEKTLNKINDEHNISTWITWAAENAEGRSMATHIIKLTNSSIPPPPVVSNINDKTDSMSPRYLTTSAISNPVIDGTGNAALAPITGLLELEHNGKMLADYVVQNDGSPLSEFSTDTQQIKNWVAGLIKAIDSPQKNSHGLAKQVYFPISANNYHIVLPMVSSTMAHSLFTKFKDYSYEKQKKVIEKRSNKIYAKDTIVSFPNRAVVKVTASNHQNASSLNGKRGGRLSLLSSSPPIWKTTTRLPLKVNSLFDGNFRFIARDRILELRNFLLLIKTKKLNIKDRKLHRHLIDLLDLVIDELFNYVLSIHKNTKQPGWSADSKLKLSHQQWLDPYRDDEGFQQQLNNRGYQEEICADFASWLNKQLSFKKLTLSLAQETFWEKTMQQRLREFEATRKVQA